MAIKNTGSSNIVSATLVVAASDSLHPERADYVCDGINDQAEIQTAIDALTNRGGTISMLNGKYNFAACTEWSKDGVIIEGNGGTEIFMGNNTNCATFHIRGSQSRLSNIKIDGNKANNPSEIHAIQIGSNSKPISDFIMANCYIKDSNGDGIEIGNCAIVPKRMTIMNNIMIGCREHDVHIHGAEQITITGNKLMNNEFMSVYIAAGASSHPNKDIFITNNHISGASDGITLGWSSGWSTQEVLRTVVIGNYITDCTQGMYLQGEGLVKDSLIANNIIRSSTNEAILDCSENAKFYGNFIHGNGGDVKAAAVGLRGENTIFDGNEVAFSKYHGVYIEDHAGIYADKVQVTNNIIHDNSQDTHNTKAELSARLNGFDTHHLIIRGNTMYSESANQSMWGLALTDGSGGTYNYYDCIVENNVIWGTMGTATISLDRFINSIFKNNVGFTTKNSGTSTGTGAQQTIAHGLAATPTKVILWNIEDGANPYQSAVADTTNIYITAVNNQDYGWEAEVV